MEITGEIKDIIYKNEINSYTIADFETDEEETTIVGYLPFVNPGDTLKLIGKFVEHKDYGRQFKIDTFEKLMPQPLGALERYLSKGNIKGIGEAIAKRIIRTFGEETIHVFKYEPERLATIRGISKERAKEMSNQFIENWEVWQIVGFLEKFGIGVEKAPQSWYNRLDRRRVKYAACEYLRQTACSARGSGPPPPLRRSPRARRAWHVRQLVARAKQRRAARLIHSRVQRAKSVKAKKPIP